MMDVIEEIIKFRKDLDDAKKEIKGISGKNKKSAPAKKTRINARIIGNYLIMRRLHDTSVVRLLLMRQDFLQTVPKITCVHSTGLLLKEFDSIKI